MISSRQNQYGPDTESAAVRRDESSHPLRAITSWLSRQGWFVLGLTTLLCVIAFLVISNLPGRFKSEAVLLIQPGSNLADPSSGPFQTPPDIIRSQLEILKSPTVITKVVDRLRLLNDDDFTVSGASASSNADVRRAAVVSAIIEDLEVENDGRSATIKLSFESGSPLKAMRVVDEITKQFMATSAELKNDSVDATKSRLDAQLETLRAEMIQAEQAAETFRRSAGLVWLSLGADGNDAGAGITYQARLLDEFSRQAADISAMASLTKAKQGNSNANMPEILSSNTMSALLQRDAELAETEAAMATRYNAKYPPLARIRSQRARLRSTLNTTKSSIVSSIGVEVARAQAANKEATAKAAALERKVNQQISDSVRYRQLQRDALAKRQAYERTSEQSIKVAQRLMLQLPNSIVVSGASLPIKEDGPKRAMLYSISCIAAAAFAIFLGLLAEFMRLGRIRDRK